MRIIAFSALRTFWSEYPASERPLRYWYEQALAANWRSFPDVKSTLGQTDQARVASGQTVCIFDIGGNKFRLVALVAYPKRKVYVLRVMTHKEYDRKDWVKEL